MGKKNRQKDDYWDNAAGDEETQAEEEDVPVPAPKKSAAPKSKKVESKPVEDEDEEDVTAQVESLNLEGKKKKKKAAKPAPAAKPVEEKKEEAEPAEAEENAGGELNLTGKKKKRGKKEAAPAADNEKAAEKAPVKKKGGISASVAAAIRAKQEEDERLAKIEEERLARLAEEEEIERQRTAEEEATAKRKKEEKKVKDKEKKIEREKKQKEEQLSLARQRLGLGNSLPTGGAPAQSEEKPVEAGKPKVIYNSKKKKKTKDEETAVTNQEKPKEEEPLDDWESVLEDSEPAAPAENVAPVEASAPVEKSTKEEAKTESKEEEEFEEALRSPICCVLGHVDTGKTKLLDKIRKTNVQLGEAGGITQQIGATFFPMDKLRELTSRIKASAHLKVMVPGLLIIDTPGHESFSNLRSRGSSLCDIAVLVQDITAGKMEKQTIESLEMLKKRKTPFVVALNKVDRIYGWKACNNTPIQEALKLQDKSVVAEYEEKIRDVTTFFAEKGLNVIPYYKNKDHKKFVNIIPTSAITGEGIPDMLMLLVQLTQNLMSQRLLSLDRLQCTVLEVKMVEGLGYTIDVILVNGVLHEGDQIVVCGFDGAIVTNIRALLTPDAMKEIRVKGHYVHHKSIKASQGVKISAPHLEQAVAGSTMLVCGPDDDLDAMKREVMKDLDALRSRFEVQKVGVFVQASTLGSLEALLEFLKTSKIPVAGINVGPISKKHVTAASVMLEKHKEYAVMLAFDVKLGKDVSDHAEDLGVRIFTAEIIYHLFDQFTHYLEQFNKAQQDAAAPQAVFPCRLKIAGAQYVFNKTNPIVLGVDVVDGTLRIGTPLCVPAQGFCYLGKVTGIERDHKAITEAKQASQVAVKIEMPTVDAQHKVFGRHFDLPDEIVSQISRESIDTLKEHFKEEVTGEDVKLLKKLKLLFNIQ